MKLNCKNHETSLFVTYVFYPKQHLRQCHGATMRDYKYRVEQTDPDKFCEWHDDFWMAVQAGNNGVEFKFAGIFLHNSVKQVETCFASTSPQSTLLNILHFLSKPCLSYIHLHWFEFPIDISTIFAFPFCNLPSTLSNRALHFTRTTLQ